VTVKFLNTYVRTALNARNVRATYNVLNQYRQLAEHLMSGRQDDLVVQVARYFRYYGQTARSLDLGFVTETAAYDLAALCERAHATRASCHDSLLAIFLDVDKEAESKSEENILRGVRKAQVRLATYYLLHEAGDHARVIFKDMERERPERLASIRAELTAITAKDFWEVTDRGINFDFMDEARKAKIAEFFGWFPA
jgi:hypothetical protein